MGTTLTGTKPKDTYDSLIKVEDNGPLSGTAKYLSDGLGNDSALALSTARVGVGTASPVVDFQVNGAAEVTQAFSVAGTRYLQIYTDGTIGTINGLNSAPLVFSTSTGTSFAERMRITAAGNVGIGISAPTSALEIGSGLDFKLSTTGTFILGSSSQAIYKSSGADAISFNANGAERFRITANGVTFNGDTAAANALDDYEEGTWTMTLAFSGGSTGITYANRTGTYTKIGRQVTVNGYVQLSNKGSSTGNAQITGLPFTNGGSTGNYAPVSLWLGQITFATQIFAYIPISTTGLEFFEINGVTGTRTTITDADFSNTTDVILSATYFV